MIVYGNIQRPTQLFSNKMNTQDLIFTCIDKLAYWHEKDQYTQSKVKKSKDAMLLILI